MTADIPCITIQRVRNSVYWRAATAFFLILLFSALSASAAPLAPRISYLTAPMPLTQEVVQENRTRQIIRFQIQGVSENRTHIVRAIADVRAGDYLNSLNLSLIRKQLEETGLFSKIDLFYRPSRQGFHIWLRLQEKKEFLSIPVLSISGSDVYSGGAFVEEDLLNFRSPSDSSRVWQAGGIQGHIRYLNPQLSEKPQKLRVLFRGKYEEHEYALAGGEVLRNFKGYSGSLSSEWTFQTDSNLRPSFQLLYRLFDVDPNWAENYQPPDTSELIAGGTDLVFDNYYLFYYFNEGIQARLCTLGYYLFNSQEFRFSLKGWIDWNSNPAGLHRLLLGLRGGYNPAPTALLDMLEGPGHYLLPAQRSPDRLYAAAIGLYEIPVQRLPWGTLALFAFWESGLYSPDPDYRRFYTGPGVGQHLYLDGLSNPVFGVTLGYNLIDSFFSPTFFAGIQF